MHADTAVAVSSQPSGLSQALNLGGALIPRAGGPRATRRPGPATVAGRCPTRTDESEATRVHSGRGVPCSGLRTAWQLAANVEAMCEICQATLRNQTRTQFPARRGRGAAHWQDSSQVSILGHSR